jgi:hypothetical protein
VQGDRSPANVSPRGLGEAPSAFVSAALCFRECSIHSLVKRRNRFGSTFVKSLLHRQLRHAHPDRNARLVRAAHA